MWVAAELTILTKHKFYITWGRIIITISRMKLQNRKGKCDAQDHTALSSQISQFPSLAASTLVVLSQPSVSYPSPSGPCGCQVLLHGQCAKGRALQFKSPTPRGFSCCFSETDAFLCHQRWLWKQNRARVWGVGRSLGELEFSLIFVSKNLPLPAFLHTALGGESILLLPSSSLDSLVSPHLQMFYRPWASMHQDSATVSPSNSADCPALFSGKLESWFIFSRGQRNSIQADFCSSP